MRRGLFGAAGAWGQCAPAAPFRPLTERPMSFDRPECGLTRRPALNFTVRCRRVSALSCILRCLPGVRSGSGLFARRPKCLPYLRFM